MTDSGTVGATTTDCWHLTNRETLSFDTSIGSGTFRVASTAGNTLAITANSAGRTDIVGGADR